LMQQRDPRRRRLTVLVLLLLLVVRVVLTWMKAVTEVGVIAVVVVRAEELSQVS
jgi:hypothetical protein